MRRRAIGQEVYQDFPHMISAERMDGTKMPCGYTQFGGRERLSDSFVEKLFSLSSSDFGIERGDYPEFGLVVLVVLVEGSREALN